MFNRIKQSYQEQFKHPNILIDILNSKILECSMIYYSSQQKTISFALHRE
jgi:hypothetical protein